MGQVQEPPRVKLIAGLIWGTALRIEAVQDRLQEIFGNIDRKSEVWDFNYTQYYQEELGAPLNRMFVSFESLVSAGDLALIKSRTNALERDFSQEGKRKANVDPGYVDLSKLVLATTKDGNYRVYMDKGIFGQSTLYFQKGTFHPWPWTYPDYRDPRTIAFLNGVREELLAERAGQAVVR